MSQVQRHLFVIDPIEKLNLKLDSSLRMALALTKLGHEAWYVTPNELSWPSSAPMAVVRAKQMIFAGEAFQELKTKPSSLPYETIDAFNAVHIRKDPPFDENYLILTWLLESGLGKTHLFNEPQALRSLNEKTAIMLFPEETEPAFISNEPEAMYLAWKEQFSGGDVIIKPMTLFGGRGVMKLPETLFRTRDQAMQTLREHTDSGKNWRIMQKFVPEVTAGEVRAFCVGGKPIAWCMKKPAPGQYLANTAAGATLHQFKPSEALYARATRVATKLHQWGISFSGLDIINDKISELNVTSPRLLHGPDDTTDYYHMIALWIAETAKVKPTAKHWAR